MTLLVWIVLGLVAGWLASTIMRGGYGLVGDLILGIVGALVGGFISSAVFGVDVDGLNLTSILIATLGAVLVITAARAFSGRRSRRSTV